MVAVSVGYFFAGGLSKAVLTTALKSHSIMVAVHAYYRDSPVAVTCHAPSHFARYDCCPSAEIHLAFGGQLMGTCWWMGSADSAGVTLYAFSWTLPRKGGPSGQLKSRV